ncbi:MAG: HD domain-containing protein [Zetaproteobacteria bacterium]|nr:MAG: HD domain-containing protein [Zetaproteobacteria bacterium]
MRKALLVRLFDAFSIHRWNDQLRPWPLVEMDKHAHKIATVFLLGHTSARPLHWPRLIEAGIFELLRRIELADIQSPVYREIMRDPQAAARLSYWVAERIRPLLDAELAARAERYLHDPDGFFADAEHERALLEAAHRYTSWWEYTRLLAPWQPHAAEARRIEEALSEELAGYAERFPALVRLITPESKLAQFSDRIGMLRFQLRWSRVPRMPATSVLGHMMLVAIIAFLLLRQAGADETRLVNGFFRGLFHDLAEAVTRDIISPVKRAASEVERVIQEIERRQMEAHIYPLLADEPELAARLRWLITDEFVDKIDDEVVDFAESPPPPGANAVDGFLVKAADDLAAFMEAYMSRELGVQSAPMLSALYQILSKYRAPERRQKAARLGVDIAAILADFEPLA